MNSSRTASRFAQIARQSCRNYHAPFRIARPANYAKSPPSLILARTSLHPLHTPLKTASSQIRYNSTDSPQHPLTDLTSTTDANQPLTAEEIAERKAQEPSYELTFTCRKCLHRSSHRITKQAYHFGTTLITCPGCKNRHLISDHLRIFSDKSITIEDILKEKGQFLRKGRLGDDGDVEFYDEGSNEIGEALKKKKKKEGEAKGG